MSLLLKVKRIDSEVTLPSYAHEGDAACDLFSAQEVTIAPLERVQVGTGIAVEIPHGYSMFIWDKSGLSHKHGLKTLGGVIDEGFRGEVKVGLINLSDTPYTIEKNHKVAQFVLQKKETIVLQEVETLSDAQRGQGAFGSTGK